MRKDVRLTMLDRVYGAVAWRALAVDFTDIRLYVLSFDQFSVSSFGIGSHVIQKNYREIHIFGA